MHALPSRLRSTSGPSPHEQQSRPHRLERLKLLGRAAQALVCTGAGGSRISVALATQQRPSTLSTCPSVNLHSTFSGPPTAPPRSHPSHPRYFRAAPQALAGQQPRDRHLHFLCGRAWECARFRRPGRMADETVQLYSYRMPCSPPTRAMPLDLLLTEPVQARIPFRRPPPMPTPTHTPTHTPMPTSTLTACPCPPT